MSITYPGDEPAPEDEDDEPMEAFLGEVLDRHKNDSMSRENAIGVLAHLITAAEVRNYGELRAWFEEPGAALAPET